MSDKAVRRKQRFLNFDRAFELLGSAFDEKEMDDFSKFKEVLSAIKFRYLNALHCSLNGCWKGLLIDGKYCF